MSTPSAATTPLNTDRPAAFAGTEIVRSIRWLLVWALIAATLYSLFMRGSQGGCAGGLGTDGGFVDRDGSPTDVAPLCYSVTLGPSPLVLLALAVIVLWALGRVIRRARDLASADQTLQRAAMIVTGIALGSLAVGQTWFWMLPIHEWAGSGTLLLPFPLAAVTVDVTPLTLR